MLASAAMKKRQHVCTADHSTSLAGLFARTKPGEEGIFKTLPGGPRAKWLVYAPPLEFQRFKVRDGVCLLIVSLAPGARPGVYHSALWTLGGSA